MQNYLKFEVDNTDSLEDMSFQKQSFQVVEDFGAMNQIVSQLKGSASKSLNTET